VYRVGESPGSDFRSEPAKRTRFAGSWGVHSTITIRDLSRTPGHYWPMLLD